MKILVFSTDLPPLPGQASSGTAIRTHNLAKALTDLGHEVVYSVPKDALKQSSKTGSIAADDSLEKLAKFAFNSDNQQKLIDSISPDLILCGHWPAWTLQRKPRQPLIIDLAGPHLLERHYQGEPDADGALLGKLNAISSADYYIVSGPKQKRYFLSFMMRAGVLDAEKRICQIPMPLPPAQKRTTFPYVSSGEPNFLFAGVFLPWQDPSWGLKSLSKYLKQHSWGHLNLLGGPHPNYPIHSGRYTTLFSELDASPKVNSEGLVAYEMFTERMEKADVAFDLMAWNLERELAITIRTCTYLWSGLPVIYNNYADISDLICKYDAGWCVAPGDESGLTKVLDDIRLNPSIIESKSLNATLLAQTEFDQTTLARSLLDLIVLSSNRATSKQKKHQDINSCLAENCDLHLKDCASIRQRFQSRLDGLSSLEVLIASHEKEITGMLKLSLYEIPPKGERQLKYFEVKAPADIHNNAWLEISFDAIADSAGKIYDLELRLNDNSEQTLIAPWTLRSAPYPLLTLFKDSEKIPTRSLCMKSYCVPTLEQSQ